MRKFQNAFHGICSGLRHRSVVIQWVLGCAAVFFFYRLQITVSEWCFVMIAIALVLVCEYFNTALEELCNVYTKTENAAIKRIKDMAAGAVLLAAVMALVLACIITSHYI